MVVVPNLWVMLTGKPADVAALGSDDVVVSVVLEAAADAGLDDVSVVLLVALDVLDEPHAVSSARTAIAEMPAAQRRDLLPDNRSERSVGREWFVVTAGLSGRVMTRWHC